jgi:hypothetical protein
MNPTEVAFLTLSSGYVWITNSSDAELFSALQVPF